ncbi:MAATS1 isoform X1 [Labeo rohita]|uniref:MAATS1 isoform X1 n=1 Tax=Labeo rohita TaxID=84645 RepID=A0A498M045_LABRO|nr:MAATS1 isoform X1 [Labeo rohita]RXN32875.1 MAATS1 isoform X1 [Labeo rohita]
MWKTIIRVGISNYQNSVSPSIPQFRNLLACHLLSAIWLTELQRKAKENCKKAQTRQLRNDNKNSAKLALKWKGPYRIIQHVGPLNYRVALESSGEDVRIVNVFNLKPCFPAAEDLELREKKKLQEIFQETSDEEDFLGF